MEKARYEGVVKSKIHLEVPNESNALNLEGYSICMHKRQKEKSWVARIQPDPCVLCKPYEEKTVF